jgi:hypothetical protein
VLKVVSNKHNDYISIKIEVACTAATVLRIRLLLLLLKPLLLGYLIIRDVVVHLLLMLHETIHRSANRAATNLLR